LVIVVDSISFQLPITQLPISGVRLHNATGHEAVVVGGLWTHGSENVALVELDHEIECGLDHSLALERRRLLVQLRVLHHQLLRVQMAQAADLLVVA